MDEMIKRLDAGENPIDVSIKKWEDALEFAESCKVHDYSFFGDIWYMVLFADNCALCYKYIDDGCRCCPIFLKTGKAACYGTPFIEVKHAIKEQDADRLINGIKDEIKFLKSLKEDEKNGDKK